MADDTPLTDEALAATCQQVGELLEAEGRLIRVAGNVERGRQLQAAARRLRARGTCATCKHHNPEGPLCKRGLGRPNSIAPDLRVDARTFGCTLYAPQEPPDAT